MQAFYSPEQALHSPSQFMRMGKLVPAPDLPSRAQTLESALHKLGLPITEPADLGTEPLQAVHAPHYLEYLEHAWPRWQALADSGANAGPEVMANLSPYAGVPPGQRRPACPSPALIPQTGYYLGDLSCPLGTQSWRSILRSAHSAVAAADAVLAGVDKAYALCRPSGHHAHWDRASGFCYVNNNACAAQRLASHFGRVAVLDVDAHHGDGTQNIFYGRSDVLTVSVHAETSSYFPFYTGYTHETGAGEGEGFNLNLPLARGSGNPEFLEAVEHGLDAVRRFKPEALVLALGFDTFKDDPISVLKVDYDAYREIGRKLRTLSLPLVVVQEGGYLVEAIGPGLEAFLEGLNG